MFSLEKARARCGTVRLGGSWRYLSSHELFSIFVNANTQHTGAARRKGRNWRSAKRKDQESREDLGEKTGDNAEAVNNRYRERASVPKHRLKRRVFVL